MMINDGENDEENDGEYVSGDNFCDPWNILCPKLLVPNFTTLNSWSSDVSPSQKAKSKPAQ